MSWQHRAACRGADPQLFDQVGSEPTEGNREALRYCNETPCPVKAECLKAAIERGDRGVRGGLFITDANWRLVSKPDFELAAP